MWRYNTRFVAEIDRTISAVSGAAAAALLVSGDKRRLFVSGLTRVLSIAVLVVLIS
jgi:hypothetical protein